VPALNCLNLLPDGVLTTHSGRLEQVWFPGVHSNIGGGYAPDGLANEALHWIVEKAELLGLEFDSAYLAHFLPCFNSVLADSMTLMYRAMGQYIRRLGDHAAAGEAIHHAALDRARLAEYRYHPTNLTAWLPTVTTTRIARGTPCSNAAVSPGEVNRSGTAVTT
jgi:T6SS, Phospholipase effector Tle1-like, catalytic domain